MTPPSSATPPPTPEARWRWLPIAGLLLFAVLAINFVPRATDATVRDYSEIHAALTEGRVRELQVLRQEGRVRGRLHAAERGPSGAAQPERGGYLVFDSAVPTDELLTELVSKVERWNQDHPQARIPLVVVGAPSAYLVALVHALPWLLVAGVLLWFLSRHWRNLSGGLGGGFGRSRVRQGTGLRERVTFADIAGIQEAKDEVYELIQYLRDPQRFQRLGGRIPRGILLVGAPGTGKTLLARAVAGEAEVPFLSLCGSDFVEMFVGVGASRVRDLFKQAREHSPCIIFLDEIDAVGRRRGGQWHGGSEEREQTLNAILVEMDGFDSDSTVIVMAATNRPDVLDPALLRPGRFDREITVDLPDVQGRREILAVHTRRVPLAEGVDLESVARGTPAFSGADLEALVNEAALLAALEDADEVGDQHLEEARDKVCWGRARRSRILRDDERRVTAFHEAGHALLAQLLDEVEPLHKVTIIPRGPALGATMQLPEQDSYQLTRRSARGRLQVLFGGRIAELRFCGDLSSGASHDLERATELARRMVCEWGMSDAIGPLAVRGGTPEAEGPPHGEALRAAVDAEVRAILAEAYAAAEERIQHHAAEVEAIALALLERETLSGAEVAGLLESPVGAGANGPTGR